MKNNGFLLTKDNKWVRIKIEFESQRRKPINLARSLLALTEHITMLTAEQ